jgi:hypothetical protein
MEYFMTKEKAKDLESKIKSLERSKEELDRVLAMESEINILKFIAYKIIQIEQKLNGNL